MYYYYYYYYYHYHFLRSNVILSPLIKIAYCLFIFTVFRASNESGPGPPAALVNLDSSFDISGGTVGVVGLMVIMAAGMYGILKYRRGKQDQGTRILALECVILNYTNTNM